LIVDRKITGKGVWWEGGQIFWVKKKEIDSELIRLGSSEKIDLDEIADIAKFMDINLFRGEE